MKAMGCDTDGTKTNIWVDMSEMKGKGGEINHQKGCKCYEEASTLTIQLNYIIERVVEYLWYERIGADNLGLKD